MKNVCWTVLICVGMLFPALAVAQSKTPTAADKQTNLAASDSLAALLEESRMASRWRPLPPSDAMAYANDTPWPITEFRFQDTGTLARVSRLRSVSLLTLAEAGRTRLFLGVNRKGLLGVHFGALPGHGDDRWLEVARMPYLSKSEIATQVE